MYLICGYPYGPSPHFRVQRYDKKCTYASKAKIIYKKDRFYLSHIQLCTHPHIFSYGIVMWWFSSSPITKKIAIGVANSDFLISRIERLFCFEYQTYIEHVIKRAKRLKEKSLFLFIAFIFYVKISYNTVISYLPSPSRSQGFLQAPASHLAVVILKHAFVEEFVASMEVEVQIFLRVGVEYDLFAATFTDIILQEV